MAQEKLLIVSEGNITSSCRSFNKPSEYMLLARENRVEHHLPYFQGVDVQVLTTPQIDAKFVEHELLVYPNGKTSKPIVQELEQFFFVLEGELEFKLESQKHKLVVGGFSWLPPQTAFEFVNKQETTSRVIWIRRRYEQVEGIAVPAPIVANEKDVRAEPVDTYMEQHLTPYENLGFDMGINLQVFNPGVYFSFVESHVMEHGLYMLYGRGVYWLNGDYIEVQKDDYIYMAPWCPQFFYATGWDKSAYLLYKDVNRDYIQGL